MVKQWFGVSRYVYNQTIAYLKQPGTKANWKAIKGEILVALPDFCKPVPYQIKSIAVKDACKAVGDAKVIISSDGRTMNRDLNGARGIFLRALIDTPWLNRHLAV